MEYRELTEEEKSNILVQYLGNFAIYFDDTEEQLFKEKLTNLDSCLIRSSDYDKLRKAICYILLSLNKKVRYIATKSNDILDNMLDDDNYDSGDGYSFQDIQNVPLLFVYHPKIWKKNKILWETLNFLAETRLKEGKKTIIYSDAKALYDDHGTLQMDNVVTLDNNYQYPTNNATPIIANCMGSDSTYGDLYNG